MDLLPDPSRGFTGERAQLHQNLQHLSLLPALAARHDHGASLLERLSAHQAPLEEQATDLLVRGTHHDISI
jgi:hypothetical protein